MSAMAPTATDPARSNPNPRLHNTDPDPSPQTPGAAAIDRKSKGKRLYRVSNVANCSKSNNSDSSQSNGSDCSKSDSVYAPGLHTGLHVQNRSVMDSQQSD